MKLYCDICNLYQEYEVKSEPYNANVKGIEINTIIKVSYCKTCRNEIFNRNCEIENDIVVFDQYKETMGLLTSSDIKAIRNKYHISQSTFAKVLGFGEKTITRYENGSIQDESSNHLIMLVNDACNFHKLWKKQEGKLKQAENDKIKDFFNIYYDYKSQV